MCLIIAILSAVFAYNFFMASDIIMGSGAALTSLFFAIMMLRNILKRMADNRPKDSLDH
jgi:hypothetical protein